MLCINSVNIDSIEYIRDPCLVLTVLTYIVLMVWLKSPQSQLSEIFFQILNWLNIKKSYVQKCVDVFYIDCVNIHSIHSFSNFKYIVE